MQSSQAGNPAQPTQLSLNFAFNVTVSEETGQQVMLFFRQLTQLAAGAHQVPSPAPEGAAPPPDEWLSHQAAARHLRMSQSTLYKKASEGEIGYRKLCGRNEYRRSELDRYAAAKIRPARRGKTERIIPLALGSGK